MNTTETHYPYKDLYGRDGMYCMHCETIFYVPAQHSRKIWTSKCPVCGGSIYYITNNNQPHGDGF